MARAIRPDDMPEVTDTHRRQAYEVMRWYGWGFDAAMADPTLRRLIDAKAAWIRTTEWERTTRRTVVPVHRIRLGSDGHPIGWCTQVTHGNAKQAYQPDLLTNQPI